jgi:hypothetical protein
MFNVLFVDDDQKQLLITSDQSKECKKRVNMGKLSTCKCASLKLTNPKLNVNALCQCQCINTKNDRLSNGKRSMDKLKKTTNLRNKISITSKT